MQNVLSNREIWCKEWLVSASAKTFGDLSGRRAMVTGASSGIGRAIALELARGGCDVLIHYATSIWKAEQVVEEVRACGVRSQACQLNFEDGGFDDFVDAAWNIWDGVDIWVNNAGADLLTGPPAQWGFSEKLSRLWQVDVAGTLELSRSAVRRMKESGGAGSSVLNIGWDQADRGMEGDSAELFSASKNAIMGFTRSLALSAAPEVRVNCIAPGWILTAWGESASELWQSRVIRETPLARWGVPEDIAKLARFLVSDDAAFLTGQVINANGGAVR